MPLLSHPNSVLQPKEALSASPATPSCPRALAHAAPSAWNALLTSSVLPVPSSPSPPPGSPPCSLLGSHSLQGFSISKPAVLRVRLQDQMTSAVRGSLLVPRVAWHEWDPQDMGNISFSHLTNSCGTSALCQNLCWALGDTGETELRGTRLSQGGQEMGPDPLGRNGTKGRWNSDLKEVKSRRKGVPGRGNGKHKGLRRELLQTAQGTESHARNTVNVGRGAKVRGQAVPRALDSSGGSASKSRPVSPQSLGVTEGGPAPEAAEDVDGEDT